MGQPSGFAPGSGAQTPDSTATSLLERVKARDPEAWRRLVDLYGPLVYEWCRQYGVRAHDAADLGQEVFTAVAANVVRFRRDRPGDSFRAWLWTITRNKIRDHFRRLQGTARARGGTDALEQLVRVPDSPPESSISGGRPGKASELEHRAVQLVRPAVEERTWQAFWALTVEARPAADVAEELGMTVPAVYKAKYRVIRQIRRELD